MAKICLCLTGKTLERDRELLERYRGLVDLAELRVDYLDPDERFLIRRFPEMAGLPVILTVRRNIDGGRFVGGEGARIILLSKGLAFAEADRRRNFAYVDLEEDLEAPSLEEAARAFGTRIIRSYHNTEGTIDDLPGKLRGLRRVGDEIPKVAVCPHSLEDVIQLYRAARETRDMDKILLCMGNYGVSTRVLSQHTGSFLSYASIKGDPELPQAAPGQIDPRELAETYRFREITAKTRVFAVAGFPLTASASPPFFNTVFGIENIDAVYVPIPADSVESLFTLAKELGIAGMSITVPHKQAVLPYLIRRSEKVDAIGACNTIVAGPDGWHGYNTDALGFSDSLLAFARLKDLRGRKVTIIGAGGAARAVAAEIFRLRGKALILNRTVIRARELAAPYRFLWGGLDEEGLDLMRKHGDIIIQTTSAGMEPRPEGDPAPFYKFSGKELVMDLIYKPERTRFLLRAEKAGCRVQNGYDMLLRQARYQFAYFMGREFPPALIDRVGL